MMMNVMCNIRKFIQCLSNNALPKLLTNFFMKMKQYIYNLSKGAKSEKNS